MSEWLFVVCRRRYTTHARLTVEDGGLLIEYGNWQSGAFAPMTCERLRFDEWPELGVVHDGIGWDVLEVAALIRESRNVTYEKGVHVLLGQADMDILASVGVEVA